MGQTGTLALPESFFPLTYNNPQEGRPPCAILQASGPSFQMDGESRYRHITEAQCSFLFIPLVSG